MEVVNVLIDIEKEQIDILQALMSLDVMPNDCSSITMNLLQMAIDNNGYELKTLLQIHDISCNGDIDMYVYIEFDNIIHTFRNRLIRFGYLSNDFTTRVGVITNISAILHLEKINNG